MRERLDLGGMFNDVEFARAETLTEPGGGG